MAGKPPVRESPLIVNVGVTYSEDILVRARQIRLLALDSDGVLTDGGVYIDDDGTEFRRFNIKDGLGLKRVMAAGIHVVVISGAASDALLHRAHKLGVSEIYTSVEDKLALLFNLCERMGITLEQVAYMGDDLPDVSILECVGLACAPADAHLSALTKARLITRLLGGHGAVREVCDVLLQTTKVGNSNVC